MPLSNNYGMFETRLRSLHYKLKKDQNFLSEYYKIIQDQLRNGIIERVTKSNSETELKAKGTHYSPHHAVVRKDLETNKVRIVCHGRVQPRIPKKGRSLNYCLQIRGNYIPRTRIFDMLTKFRQNAWHWSDGRHRESISYRGYQVRRWGHAPILMVGRSVCIQTRNVEYRFNRLVFGLRPSRLILGATIAHHLLKIQAERTRNSRITGEVPER